MAEGPSSSGWKQTPSSSSLQALKEKSARRKELLKQTLGATSVQDLSALLGTSKPSPVTKNPSNTVVFTLAGSSKDCSLSPAAESSAVGLSTPFVVAATSKAPSESGSSRAGGDKDSLKKGAATEEEEEKVVIDDYFKVLQEEEREYKGSATFLKGTQSANPHNDYSQHFVDTGQRPQNFIRDPGLSERFEEYPKLKELIRLKDELVCETATPPMYLQADLKSTPLGDLGCRFDVILIEPPLSEYQAKARNQSVESWTWDMLEQLDIPSICDSRCFLWLWCGSSPEGTTRGRQCLRRWGFRRCEDICWIKRNVRLPDKRQQLDPDALLHRTKEHCIMGIKGTVRRSVDGDFIHANVDIDLIITEEPTTGDLRAKPLEIFLVAEHFCLGRRRLHLFGRDDTLRAGWVTVGPELTSSNFDRKKYRSLFEKQPYLTTGCTERIETLRPKSPDRGGGPKRGGAKGGGDGKMSSAGMEKKPQGGSGRGHPRGRGGRGGHLPDRRTQLTAKANTSSQKSGRPGPPFRERRPLSSGGGGLASRKRIEPASTQSASRRIKHQYRQQQSSSRAPRRILPPTRGRSTRRK